jgi:hypothetical protein
VVVRTGWTPPREDIVGVYEPVEEFDLFDQCMFTMGFTQYGTPDGTSGYAYGKDGRERRRALAVREVSVSACRFAQASPAKPSR